MKRFFLILGLVLFAPRSTPAQVSRYLDPDDRLLCWNCYSHDRHFLLVGSFGNVVARIAPFLKDEWRQSPTRRIALSAIFGTFIEVEDVFQCRLARTCGTPSAGFSVVDLVYDVSGAVVAEIVIWGFEKGFGPKLQFFAENGAVGVRIPFSRPRF